MNGNTLCMVYYNVQRAYKWMPFINTTTTKKDCLVHTIQHGIVKKHKRKCQFERALVQQYQIDIKGGMMVCEWCLLYNEDGFFCLTKQTLLAPVILHCRVQFYHLGYRRIDTTVVGLFVPFFCADNSRVVNDGQKHRLNLHGKFNSRGGMWWRFVVGFAYIFRGFL